MTKFISPRIFFLSILLLVNGLACAQLSVSSCPTIQKRNNGNGQSNNAPGTFPSYGITNSVATNVVGTPYQNVGLAPSVKTGNFTFCWTSATAITNFPVITRAWITAPGGTVAAISSVWFGPPSLASVSGNNYYVYYAFYLQNIPPQGKITLEFSDPITGVAAFTCTYDLQTNASASAPTYDCSPVITTNPANTTICGTTGATFTAAASGATAYQWQTSSNGTSGWINISNGGNYSGVTTATLTVSNPSTYDGKYFRAVITGNASCTASNTTAALLTAKAKPTAVFATTSYCGTGNRSIAVNLTGTAPWSITYTTAPSVGSPATTTVSNINSNTYYFSVNPSIATAYTITAVSDANCSNSAPTGNTTTNVYVVPTITPTNATLCYGSSSFSLAYTSTGSPNLYTLTAGVRAMPGFSTITNAVLAASPASVTIPSSVAAGTYDFNLVVSNSTSGCSSTTVPFTVTIYAATPVTATSATSSVCSGSNASITASPTSLSSYAWRINPSSTIIASTATASVTVNSTTTYTVTATNSNGCTNTSSVTVTATSGPTLTISPSAPVICYGDATILTVSGGSTYSWSPSTGLSTTSGGVVVAAPSVTTAYAVTAANSSGCQSVANVTVTVSVPVVSVTGSSTICSGTIKTLTASGGSTYLWYPNTGLYTNAAATTAYTGTSVSTVYAKPTANTTYYVKGTTAAGCNETVTTTVTISPAPVNSDTSTANNLIFCTQGVSSFPLNIKMTAIVDSAVWSYSTTGSSYTSFRNVITVSSMTLTPTTTGSNPTKKYICTLSGYGNAAYSGPRYFRLNIYNTTCNYIYDIFITDTKGTNPTPPVAAGQTTICSGNSISLNVGTLASGTTAQWQSSADSSTWANITGATSNITVSPVSTTYYRVQYNGGNGNCGSYSGAIKITVAASMGANTVTPATSCTDGSSTINLTGTAITGGSYQWQISTTSANAGFSNIIGATSQNFSLSNNIVFTTTWYRRIASTGICVTDSSVAAIVYAPIANNQITNSVTSYCGSASATVLTGSSLVGGSGTYTYQWKNSTDGTVFSNISGATSINYTTPVTATTTYYQRLVTSGGCSGTSNNFIVTVNANPTVASSSNSTVCSGTNVTLTASGANTYSWSPSTELSATTGTTLVATPTATRTYTITGTNSNGCTSTSTTTLTVNALPSSPTLSASSQTICSGTISLPSKVTSGGTTNWYTAPEANASYIVGTPTSVGAGIYYAFGVSGSCYSSGNTSFSLTVSNVSVPSPSGTTLAYCSPATADLTTLQPLPATGTSLEWHTVPSSPTSGNIVATPSSAGSGTYYLYAYSSAGSCFGTASAPVSVTINSTPTSSVSSTSITACNPSIVNLDTYNNTAGTNTYNWYTSSTASLSTLVQVPTAISSTGTFYLIATSSLGCTAAASPGVSVTINPVPTTSISSPDAACGTSGRTITGTTNAISPSYQWQYSGNNGSTWTNMTNTGVYTGVTTNAMSINNTNGLGGSYYRFTVTGVNGCSATSIAAVLTEDATPIVSSNPANVGTYAGSTSTFSVAQSSATAEYQWMVSTDNGSTFSNLTENANYYGVTSPTLVASNISVSQDNYLYKVVITNSCNNISSSAARLNVSGALPVTWVSVTASKQNESTVLNWSTGSEADTKNFVVQRSIDGMEWKDLGSIDAAGFNNSLKNYSYTDDHPEAGINYYRLQQNDMDGRYHLSWVVSVTFDLQQSAFKIFPNPASRVLNIQGAATQIVSIINMQGQTIISKRIDEESEAFDVSYVSKGLYKVILGSNIVSVVIQ